MSHDDPSLVGPNGKIDVTTFAINELDLLPHFSRKRKTIQNPNICQFRQNRAVTMRFCQNLVEKEREQQGALIGEESMKKKKVLRRKKTIEIFQTTRRRNRTPIDFT
jgi:hypothetical protein